MKIRTKLSNQLKQRVLLLTNSIANQQKKWYFYQMIVLIKFPKIKKLLYKKLLTPPEKNDPRGRRYTDEFIILCLLMNIKSKSYYEFLRTHNIISLPCTKTIQNYMSFVGSKCGFDEDFFKLMKKSFEKKDYKKGTAF